MPNFKSISFKMAVLQEGGGGGGRAELCVCYPKDRTMCVLSKRQDHVCVIPPCVCYPKDPMWNRVKFNSPLGTPHCQC